MDEDQTPALMTQAEYARHRNCSQAYISQLKAANRLVMSGDLVDVIATDKALGAVESGGSNSTPSADGTDHSRAQRRLL